ncbi:retrotrans_gag domain-containing protein [Trichonephila clavipes]|nr:retrotrans_gag domain-containing protein [Trichonephila clavipes]
MDFNGKSSYYDKDISNAFVKFYSNNQRLELDLRRRQRIMRKDINRYRRTACNIQNIFIKTFDLIQLQEETSKEWSLRLRGLSPEFGLLKENSRKRTKIPTEQEAKPAVVTLSLQQWRSPSTFRGAPGEDPLKWLKEYDRVANFNKWDDMMCLANVYFFLDGTARQWYVNNEDALDSWEAFKNGLSGLFGDRQKYTREGQKSN